MPLDFYDRYGKAYAYSPDDEHIYTYAGRPIAYLRDRSVYTFGGTHLGFFENGLIWDVMGSVVLFTNEANGGPHRPMRGMRPTKMMRLMRPMKGMRQSPPSRRMKSQSWSTLAPDGFFRR